MLVRLFGVFRLKSGVARLELDINDGSELFKRLEEVIPSIPASEWEKSVLYLNSKPVSIGKMKKAVLSQSDEVLLMSPVSGG